MLVDSHCHLDFPELHEQLDDVLERAQAADIGVMQTISTKISTFPNVLAVAEAHPHIYCSVGIHPHHVEEEEAVSAAQLVELAQHEKVIGIGETGLDYYYEHSPREFQQQSFREHIAASRETGLPVIVHSRSADEDTVKILQEEMDKGPFPGLIHCFSTGEYLAQNAVKLGLSISLSGILTFKKSQDLRDIASRIPLENLLVETDAPFLAPVPYRGKTNEPAYTVETAKCLADIKGISYDEVAKVTTDNFFRLFAKAKRP